MSVMARHFSERHSGYQGLIIRAQIEFTNLNTTCSWGTGLGTLKMLKLEKASVTASVASRIAIWASPGNIRKMQITRPLLFS